MKIPSLGIGLTALGFAQVRLGMPLYFKRYGDITPKGVLGICKLSRTDCVEKILTLHSDGLLVGVISLALLFGIFRAFWSRSKSGESL